MRGEACQPLPPGLELQYCQTQLSSPGWFVASSAQGTPQRAEWEGKERLEALAEPLVCSATPFPHPTSRLGMFSQPEAELLPLSC